MNERAKRIKKLVDESGKSYSELEKMTGVSRSSLQRYASGVTTKIPLDVIAILEKAFGVPRGYIMGWDEKEPEDLGALAANVLTDPNTFRLVQDFRSLSESDQNTVLALVASLAAKNKKD